MQRTQKNRPDKTLLQAALDGLELQRQQIDESISQVRAMLGDGGGNRRGRLTVRHSTRRGGGSAGKGRRPLSAAARKRIAAAQKRRWAEYRKKASAGNAG